MGLMRLARPAVIPTQYAHMRIRLSPMRIRLSRAPSFRVSPCDFFHPWEMLVMSVISDHIAFERLHSEHMRQSYGVSPRHPLQAQSHTLTPVVRPRVALSLR